MLARTSGGDVAGRPPEWLSTHPDPGNREQAAQERLKSLDRDPGTMRRGRDEFLRRLEGLSYGANPRDGFFRGQTFYHPDLNLQLAFPGGWRTENRPDAVVAGEPNGAAVISIQLAQGTPHEALRRFTGQQALSDVREADYRAPLGTTRSAAFSAQAEKGKIEGVVAFVGQGSRTYQLLGLAGSGQLQALDGAFRPVVSSLTSIGDASIREVQPARIKIVTLPRDMTSEEFLRAYPTSLPAEEAMTANGIDAGQRLPKGMLLKQVTGGVKQ
jgi:predicted Zn-dependent protease